MYDLSNLEQLEQLEEMLDAGSLLSMLANIPGSIISLAVYIFTALALYTIANRRGIKNPWLAWIPWGNMWILGSIADDYQMKANGRKKARRKVLLGTSIATSALVMVVLALVIVMMVCIFAAMLSGAGLENLELSDDATLVVGFAALGAVLFSLPMLALAIVQAIFQFIALYEVYKSCDPGNAVLYLVLSIFINLCQPVFLFISRNKDDGMPKPQPQIPPVTFAPAAPAQEQHNDPTQL